MRRGSLKIGVRGAGVWWIFGKFVGGSGGEGRGLWAWVMREMGGKTVDVVGRLGYGLRVEWNG